MHTKKEIKFQPLLHTHNLRQDLYPLKSSQFQVFILYIPVYNTFATHSYTVVLKGFTLYQLVNIYIPKVVINLYVITKIKSTPPTYSFSVFIKLFNLLVSSVTTMSMIMPYLIHKKNLTLNIISFIRFNITVYNCVH